MMGKGFLNGMERTGRSLEVDARRVNEASQTKAVYEWMCEELRGDRVGDEVRRVKE